VLESVWTESLERFDKQIMANHLKKSRQDAQSWMQARKKKLGEVQERHGPLIKLFENQIAAVF